MKVGFIGLGNMGSALATAVANCPEVDLLLSHHNLEKAKAVQELVGGRLLSNDAIARQADVVFVGVKPQGLPNLLSEFSGTTKSDSIWVSMAAGVSLEQLEHYLPGVAWVRIMPNTPVAIGQGMTTATTRSSVGKELISSLLMTSGKLEWLPENLIDVATGIAGCGPAFVYTFIEALADAGVQNGLPRHTALSLASQTVRGAGQLALSSVLHPAQLRDAVCSPGGATIAGIAALEKEGFRHATMSGVSAAIERTKKLVKQ